MELTDSFEALADSEMWVEAAAVGGGLAAPSVVESGIERIGMVPNLPAEGYAAVAIVLLQMFDVPYGAQMQMGAGANAVINGAKRFTEGTAADSYIPEA